MVSLGNIASGARKPGLKALLVALLVTLMFVPVTFVTSLIEERQQRAEAVTGEVGHVWGGRDQVVAGPFLVVPYETERFKTRQGEPQAELQRSYAVVLPEKLAIRADIDTEIRYRGIFEVPVYQAKISVSGQFEAAELAPWIGDATRVLAEEAFVVLNISDPRGLRSTVTLAWDGAARAFRPGPRLDVFGQGGIHAMLQAVAPAGETSTATPAAASGAGTEEEEGAEERGGVRAPAKLPGAAAPGAPVTFSFDLTLNGSRTLKFLPVGRSSEIALAADWPGPSFSGGFLPTEHDVTTRGFTASWQVPDLARNFPQSWRAGEEPEMDAALVGVDLHEGVDFYQKVARSTKYAILFFGFTFLAFFLTEIMSSARIHPVQYLMAGAAQVIFYLLLLSIAEHVGFDTAYAAASAATILLVTLYGGSAVRSAAFAVVLFIVLVATYALLYSLLQAGDYALLFGSVAAFLGLAVTMLLTRRVDWYGLTEPERS